MSSSTFSPSTRNISLTREGVAFRLVLSPPVPEVIARIKPLPYASFDDESRSWTVQVCAQSVSALRQWYREGLTDVLVDTLLAPGEAPVVAANAVLRPGTSGRPFRVSMATRDDQVYARLRAIPGSSWNKNSSSISYPPQGAAALMELVSAGVIDDPEKLLVGADVSISFDARTGLFVLRGDERAQRSFDMHYPANDVVRVWKDRGIDIKFTDDFSREVYNGELARAHPGLPPEGMNVTLYPYQTQSVNVALARSGFGVFHDMGLGKGQVIGTNVLTPDGWVKIEDIKVGDKVIGSSGKSIGVIGVFPRGELDVFRVTLNDKTSVVVDGDHLWAVQHVQNGERRRPGEWDVKETREIAAHIADVNGNLTWKIPMVKPVHFTPGSPLPVDPYILGALLGDGSIGYKAVSLCSDDQSIVDEIAQRLPEGLHIKKCKAKYMYSIITSPRAAHNTMRTALDSLGLRTRAWEKHIPEIYLRASVQDRWDLLRGLMDTDGNAGPDGTNEYVSVSKDLADGVAELVQSLGGVVRRSTKQPKVKKGNARLAYRVNVKLNECPFLLPRKAGAWKKPTKYPPNRAIKSIEPEGRAEVVCISTDADDQLYVTEHYIVTHNTVIAIAVAHELMFNRGELPRSVIVVPGSVRSQWEDEINRFSHGEVVVIDGSPKKRKALYEAAANAPWLIVNYDLAHRDLSYLTPLTSGALLVADEVHRIKNPEAQRTKALRSLATRSSRRLGLSGTPVQNDPGEWLSVVSGFLVPGAFGNPKEFLNRYSYPGTFGGWEGARNLDELRQRSATYYIRYTKPEVAQHLPPLRVQTRVLDVDPAYRNALARAHREARAEIKAAALAVAKKSGRVGHALDGTDVDEIAMGAEMTAVGMLRQLCSSPRIVEASDSPSAKALVEAGLLPDADGPKVDELRSMAAELQAEGQRVVIFTFSKRLAYLISDRFATDGIRHVTFTGDTSSADREAARLAFNAPPTEDNPGPTAFVATDAGGEGLNLGGYCSLLINVDVPWTPGVLSQRSSRIHRIDGTAEKYLVINFTLRGTIEEGILRMIERKADLQDSIFGEGGGRARTTGRRTRSYVEEALDSWDKEG